MATHTRGIDAVAARLIPAGAVIERVYWALPGHYGIGPEFDTEAEAIAAGISERESLAAAHLASRNRTGEQSFVAERFSVDLRWNLTYPAGGGTDTCVSRTTYETLADARAHLDRIEKYAHP